MKRRIGDHSQKEIMIHDIKCLRDVKAGDACTSWWLRVVKSRNGGGDDGEESGGGGVEGGKTMLGRGAVEGSGEREEGDARGV